MNIISSKGMIASTILLMLSTVILGYTIDYYGINIPYNDDYNQQLGRLLGLHEGRLSLASFLFDQHNEHRLFTTHIFTYLEYLITGSVNLKTQLIISLIIKVVLCCTLISFCSKSNRVLGTFLCCALLMVPSHVSIWVGGSIQYYSVVLFGLLSLKYINQIDNQKYLVISICCAFLAIFSMISGIIVSLVGCIFLFLNKKMTATPKLIWGGSNALFLLFYFLNYSSISHHPSIFAFLEAPIFTINFSGVLLSAFWEVVVPRYLLVVLTILSMIYWAWVVISKIGVNKLFSSQLGAPLLYVLLLSFSVIAGRVGFEYLGTASAPKYFVFTKSVWILGLFFLINSGEFKKTLSTVSVVLFSYFFASTYYMHIPKMEHFQKQKLNEGMLSVLFKDDYKGIANPRPKRWLGTLSDTIALGLYRPEIITSRQLEPMEFTDLQNDAELDVLIQVIDS
ncbi:MAG: hypothetical protein JKX81_04815, partial [Arenicella sp.]|nr:hypothetical protein [Arenicella sp.]